VTGFAQRFGRQALLPERGHWCADFAVVERDGVRTGMEQNGRSNCFAQFAAEPAEVFGIARIGC
jgi:hypothetical protein